VAVLTLIVNMRRLLNNPDFSDITFVVEGKRLYAHKAILVAQCEHSHAMFSGERILESHKMEIEIPQWGFTAFAAMLEWLYTGHTPRELPAVHLMEVLGLANHYTLDGLKHACEHALVNSVEIDNVCALLRFADQFSAHVLKRHCLTFILGNFDQVAHTTAFDELRAIPSLLLEVTRAAATSEPDPRRAATGPRHGDEADGSFDAGVLHAGRESQTADGNLEVDKGPAQRTVRGYVTGSQGVSGASWRSFFGDVFSEIGCQTDPCVRGPPTNTRTTGTVTSRPRRTTRSTGTSTVLDFQRGAGNDGEPKRFLLDSHLAHIVQTKNQPAQAASELLLGGPPRSSRAEDADGKLQAVVELGEFCPDFKAKYKFLGFNGQFLNHIRACTGAIVWLREAPLQIVVTANTPEALDHAVHLASDLAMSVLADYDSWRVRRQTAAAWRDGEQSQQPERQLVQQQSEQLPQLAHPGQSVRSSAEHGSEARPSRTDGPAWLPSGRERRQRRQRSLA
jgi:hypothetical protein